MIKTKQRLAQIKTSLEQQDFEMAQLQGTLLSDIPEVFNIIECLQKQAYQRALELIECYFETKNLEIVQYQDTEIEDLRAQLRELETAIESLSEQKSEQLFVLNEFTTKQSMATGELIQQILQIRKDIEQEKLRQEQARYQEAEQNLLDEQNKLKRLKKKRDKLKKLLEELDGCDPFYDDVEKSIDSLSEDIKKQKKRVKKNRKKTEQEDNSVKEKAEDAYKEAQKEYEQFDESYQEAMEDKVVQLTDEDANLLKSLFRKAVKLCHPDTVTDDYKKQAHDITQQLNNARDDGDIAAIKALSSQLQKGMAFRVASDSLTDMVQIENKIGQLVIKLEKLNDDIEEINRNETWQLIASIESWEVYFEEQKSELIDYLELLKAERERVFNPKNSYKSNSSASEVSESSIKSKSHADEYWSEEF